VIQRAWDSDRVKTLLDPDKLDLQAVYTTSLDVPPAVADALSEGYRLDLSRAVPRPPFPVLALVPGLVSLAGLVWWWFASLELGDTLNPWLMFVVAGVVAAVALSCSRWARHRQRMSAPLVVENLLPPEQAALDALTKPLLAIEALNAELGGPVDFGHIRSDTVAVKPRLLESSRRRASTQDPKTLETLDTSLASIISRVDALNRIQNSLARAVHELREEITQRQVPASQPVDELLVSTATDPLSRSYLEEVAEQLERQHR